MSVGDGGARETCHDIGERKAALTDMFCNHFGKLSLAKMDMEVCG